MATSHPHFASADELLNFCWVRNIGFAQFADMAQANGFMVDEQVFLRSCEELTAKMEEDYRAEIEMAGGIVSEHF